MIAKTRLQPATDVFGVLDTLIAARAMLPEFGAKYQYPERGNHTVVLLRDLRDEGRLPSGGASDPLAVRRIRTGLSDTCDATTGMEYALALESLELYDIDMNGAERLVPVERYGEMPRGAMANFCWYLFSESARYAINCLAHTEGRGFTYWGNPESQGIQFWEDRAVKHCAALLRFLQG